jgi:hypothetical protein
MKVSTWILPTAFVETEMASVRVPEHTKNFDLNEAAIYYLMSTI